MHQPRRRAFSLGLAAASAAPWSFAVPAASPAPAEAGGFKLLVNEGATTIVDPNELRSRYQPIAALLARTAGRPVEVEAYEKVGEFLRVLETLPAFVFCKTVDLLAKEVKQGRYLPLAKIDKPYVAGIISASNAKLTTLRDLLGHRVLLPPPNVMTSKLALAAFADAKLPVVILDGDDPNGFLPRDKVGIRHVRWQEAVSQAVERGIDVAGAVNPTLLSRWKGNVLVKFKPQVNWSLGVLADMPPRTVAALTQALTTMHTQPSGQEALARLGIQKFVVAEAPEFVALADYVK